MTKAALAQTSKAEQRVGREAALGVLGNAHSKDEPQLAGGV